MDCFAFIECARICGSICSNNGIKPRMIFVQAIVPVNTPVSVSRCRHHPTNANQMDFSLIISRLPVPETSVASWVHETETAVESKALWISSGRKGPCWVHSAAFLEQNALVSWLAFDQADRVSAAEYDWSGFPSGGASRTHNMVWKWIVAFIRSNESLSGIALCFRMTLVPLL